MLDFTDIPGDSFHVGPAVGIGSNLDLSRINVSGARTPWYRCFWQCEILASKNMEAI